VRRFTNSSGFSYKRFGWKICGLEFLANFIPEVALNYARTPQDFHVSQNFPNHAGLLNSIKAETEEDILQFPR
jgi:hypothetical protein